MVDWSSAHRSLSIANFAGPGRMIPLGSVVGRGEEAIPSCITRSSTPSYLSEVFLFVHCAGWSDGRT